MSSCSFLVTSLEFSMHSMPSTNSDSLTSSAIWIPFNEASLSFTISQSLLQLMTIEPVMPSNHLILCLPLLLPSVFPSTRVFPSVLALCIRWPEYWSFNISPSNDIQGWFPFHFYGLISLLSKGVSRVFLQHHSSKPSILWHSAFFMVHFSQPYLTTGQTIALTI